jgi:hypothetical protein
MVRIEDNTSCATPFERVFLICFCSLHPFVPSTVVEK